jgi:uncharacterized OB-fold protein
VCGEKGHRQFECPQRSKTFKAAGVKCSICGDLSHPTRDCPQKKVSTDVYACVVFPAYPTCLLIQK